MHPLRGTVQAYAWGMIGSQSLVAQLASKSSTIDAKQPYAEYWMGTHPKGQSFLVNPTEKSLKEYLGKDLPFLFKVLSVRTALSIQAHPNKEHARILHQQNPKEYPDDNHKPEMAVALTKFECLCAFRPYEEINRFLQQYEQLQILCDKKSCQKFADAIASKAHSSTQQTLLKEIYSNLMQSSPAMIAQCVDAHLLHISSSDNNAELSQLFQRLNQQYPGGDVGLFSIYFFNYIHLQPGEAILLKANVPHAYLHGECIECMACSDNVVRAGLTPKFKDISTLTEMLDYHPLTIEQTKFTGKKISPTTIEFDPKGVSIIDDFIVQEIHGKEGKIDPLDQPSLLVIVQGNGKMNDKKISFEPASFFLIDPKTTIDFQANDQLLAYRAYSLLN